MTTSLDSARLVAFIKEERLREATQGAKDDVHDHEQAQYVFLRNGDFWKIDELKCNSLHDLAIRLFDTRACWMMEDKAPLHYSCSWPFNELVEQVVMPKPSNGTGSLKPLLTTTYREFSLLIAYEGYNSFAAALGGRL
eukprot:GHVU01172878.1.p1 GENE.GHVU01172878.1~~GHVU01172878.1.p1  ORF type:complete len:138 (-),score=18.76 GHVU01172878.1:186-599(-)